MTPTIFLTLFSPVASATTYVAVVEGTSNETSADVAAQLNDDTWFDFEATVVDVTDVDTLKEMSGYDVIVLGGSGHGAPDWTKDFVSTLDTFVRGGGGMVGTGWFHYTVDNTSYESTFDDLMPIDMASEGYQYCYTSLSLVIEKTSHSITDGIKDFTTTSSHIEVSSFAPDTKTGELLATASGSGCSSSGGTYNALVADTVDSGNVVYLGLMYLASSSYSPTDLRSGAADQLLEQAVYWAAEGGDADGDGFSGGADCDDDDASVNPDATEIWYDGVDQDCAGDSDFDVDLDSYDSSDYGGLDCDDGDETINPDATEIWYDGVDQDCAGDSDYDVDLDSYDSSDYGGLDCDDGDALISPDAEEVWYDGVDQDCDGTDADADGDGYDSSDYGGDDCDDGDALINPGADEIWYDGVDQDCAGGEDYDADQDGYPRTEDDCEDGDPAINPGAEEIDGDGIDNDCDGEIDVKNDGTTTGSCAAVSARGSGLVVVLSMLVLGLRRRR